MSAEGRGRQEQPFSTSIVRGRENDDERSRSKEERAAPLAAVYKSAFNLVSARRTAKLSRL
jgi:hypothetical protein